MQTYSISKVVRTADNCITGSKNSRKMTKQPTPKTHMVVTMLTICNQCFLVMAVLQLTLPATLSILYKLPQTPQLNSSLFSALWNNSLNFLNIKKTTDNKQKCIDVFVTNPQNYICVRKHFRRKQWDITCKKREISQILIFCLKHYFFIVNHRTGAMLRLFFPLKIHRK